MKEFRVDPKKVYLTGCSMGGEGVWRLALASPHRFAAIAPVCGDAPSEALPDKVARLKVALLLFLLYDALSVTPWRLSRLCRLGCSTVSKTTWCPSMTQ
jgi:poly(3-hydroxybutyrate) depolymerase